MLIRRNTYFNTHLKTLFQLADMQLEKILLNPIFDNLSLYRFHSISIMVFKDLEAEPFGIGKELERENNYHH